MVPNQGQVTLDRGEAVSVGMPEEALRVLRSEGELSRQERAVD